MTATPPVSVIIPAFNVEHTIARALNSVFAQTFNDYEVIVIDDGSKDNLASALEPFKHRITVKRQNNMGAASARNHGARIASGELLAFLDADDFWHPRKLEIQTQVFKNNHDLAFCATQCQILRSVDLLHTDYLELSAEPEIKRIDDFSTVFSNPYFGTPGVLMPKQVFFGHGGFKENLRTAEDIDLWLRAAYKSTFAYVLAPLFYVARALPSLTTALVDRTYIDNIKVIDLFCEEHPEFKQGNLNTVKSALARVYEDWGSSALSRGEKKFAREKLLASLRNRISPRSLYLLSKTFLP